MSAAVDKVIRRLDAEFKPAVERLTQLLRIPSVSTDPAFRAETRRAADFIAKDLAGMGFKVKVAHGTYGDITRTLIADCYANGDIAFRSVKLEYAELDPSNWPGAYISVVAGRGSAGGAPNPHWYLYALDTSDGLPPPCRADFNSDGELSSQDFFDFLAAFFASAADFNEDGATSSQDFFDFLAAFFVGC